MSRDFERLRTCKAGFECNVDKVNQNSRTAGFKISFKLLAYKKGAIFRCLYWSLLIIF